jgi:hypothetical protein
MGKSPKAMYAGGSSSSKSAFAKALHAVRLKKGVQHAQGSGINEAVHRGGVVEKQMKQK